ncbi:hypothetical protein CHGG_02241 [Chaetomium globosum CBS 148.51]|uniref:Uncharacterized protein n=1 Tax=Chaetomium globosum (strain ATCC 6205 / CBS 148.51 / DSM 1962 / NBRC 6347 / NRRL 1970) TaxID=306901 RepID=Q2HC13_CHAGB|nr:uncharacterized protein CHGG_02241 [Chaetomium globosum CBS 148.51]EAQ90306.1 hypothetical protein CHGG_02241 [Chaetomium globosum CBS 148.51]
MFTSYRRSANYTKLQCQFTYFGAPESAKHEEWKRTARRGNAPLDNHGTQEFPDFENRLQRPDLDDGRGGKKTAASVVLTACRKIQQRLSSRRGNRGRPRTLGPQGPTAVERAAGTHYPSLRLQGFLFSRRSSRHNNTYGIFLFAARVHPPLPMPSNRIFTPIIDPSATHSPYTNRHQTWLLKHGPNTPRTRDPGNVRHQDQAYNRPPTENEYELTSNTGPHETIPSDPPPSYRSQKSNPSNDNLTSPTPPPFSTANITITSLADTDHPPPSLPPYLPPNAQRAPPPNPPNPKTCARHLTDAEHHITIPNPLNNRYVRKWPRAGKMACATVLVLTALAAALALLFAITVAVLSIARPPRHGRHHPYLCQLAEQRLPGPRLEPKLCSWCLPRLTDPKNRSDNVSKASPSPVQILEQHFSSRLTGKFTKLDLVAIVSLFIFRSPHHQRMKLTKDFKLHTMASPTTRTAEAEAEEKKILAQYKAQELYDMLLLKQASEGYDAL